MFSTSLASWEKMRAATGSLWDESAAFAVVRSESEAKAETLNAATARNTTSLSTERILPPKVLKTSFGQFENNMHVSGRVQRLSILLCRMEPDLGRGALCGFIQTVSQTSYHAEVSQSAVRGERYCHQDFAFHVQPPRFVGVDRTRLEQNLNRSDISRLCRHRFQLRSRYGRLIEAGLSNPAFAAVIAIARSCGSIAKARTRYCAFCAARSASPVALARTCGQIKRSQSSHA